MHSAPFVSMVTDDFPIVEKYRFGSSKTQSYIFKLKKLKSLNLERQDHFFTGVHSGDGQKIATLDGHRVITMPGLCIIHLGGDQYVG